MKQFMRPSMCAASTGRLSKASSHCSFSFQRVLRKRDSCFVLQSAVRCSMIAMKGGVSYERRNCKCQSRI